MGTVKLRQIWIYLGQNILINKWSVMIQRFYEYFGFTVYIIRIIVYQFYLCCLPTCTLWKIERDWMYFLNVKIACCCLRVRERQWDRKIVMILPQNSRLSGWISLETAHTRFCGPKRYSSIQKYIQTHLFEEKMYVGKKRWSSGSIIALIIYIF